jgi:hypothetical protein
MARGPLLKQDPVSQGQEIESFHWVKNRAIAPAATRLPSADQCESRPAK